MDDGGITEPAMNPGAWANSPLAHRNASARDEPALHMTTDYGHCARSAEVKMIGKPFTILGQRLVAIDDELRRATRSRAASFQPWT
jgi:hypothetical protein